MSMVDDNNQFVENKATFSTRNQFLNQDRINNFNNNRRNRNRNQNQKPDTYRPNNPYIQKESNVNSVPNTKNHTENNQPLVPQPTMGESTNPISQSSSTNAQPVQLTIDNKDSDLPSSGWTFMQDEAKYKYFDNIGIYNSLFNNDETDTIMTDNNEKGNNVTESSSVPTVLPGGSLPQD